MAQIRVIRAATAFLALQLLLTSCGPRNQEDPVFRDKRLSQWVKEVSSPDETTRANAAWTLGEYLAKHGVRLRGTVRLAAVENAAAAALSDASPKVRGVAADSLAAAGPGAAGLSEAIGKALADDEIVVRLKAAWAVGNIGQDAAVALPMLAKTLRDDVGQVRRRAIWAMGKVGPAAAPFARALLDAIDAEKGGEREEAFRLSLETLVAMGAGAVPVLTEAVSGESLDLRSLGAEACGLIGPEAAAAKDALVDAVGRDGDMPSFADSRYVTVRCKAAEALGRIGAANDKALAALSGALVGRNYEVAAHAARGLAQLGPKAASAVDALALSLGRYDACLKIEALRALTKIGTEAKPALPEIKKLVNDPDPEIARLAVLLADSLGKQAAPGR